MTLAVAIEHLIDDPDVAASVTQLVEKLLVDAHAETDRKTREVERQSIELHAARTKIQALTLELAHLKRMRFGVKSEALDAESRDLFQETLAADVAAAEAELARRQAQASEAAASAARTRRSPGPA